jgi:hypothetical protein
MLGQYARKRYLFLKHFLGGELFEKRATLKSQYSADSQALTVKQGSYREKAFKAEFIIVWSVFGTCNADKCNDVVKKKNKSEVIEEPSTGSWR